VIIGDDKVEFIRDYNHDAYMTIIDHFYPYCLSDSFIYQGSHTYTGYILSIAGYYKHIGDIPYTVAHSEYASNLMSKFGYVLTTNKFLGFDKIDFGENKRTEKGYHLLTVHSNGGEQIDYYLTANEFETSCNFVDDSVYEDEVVIKAIEDIYYYIENTIKVHKFLNN
jgi:hypothetical protein